MDFKDFKDKMHAIYSYTPDLIELNYRCFVCKRLHFHFFTRTPYIRLRVHICIKES